MNDREEFFGKLNPIATMIELLIEEQVSQRFNRTYGLLNERELEVEALRKENKLLTEKILEIDKELQKRGI